MKLKKYTFRTPLFGSINCEELLLDTDGQIELSPEQMCRLYDDNEELLMFLTGNMEDLAEYVPGELMNVVLRAEFGDFAMIGGKMYLRTYIWTEEDLTELQISMIQEWITGQMSDGWGESLEQNEWMYRRVERPYVYFDEDSVDFEEDYETCGVYYYVHPWNAGEYYIEMEECEEVEEYTSFEIVATLTLYPINRRVLKFTNWLSLRMFLKDLNMMYFAQEIKESFTVPSSVVYLVNDMTASDGRKVPSKWICESGSTCALYDYSENNYTGISVTLREAVLELLK